MRVRELLKDAVRRLAASGSPDPEADAAWLMSDALRVSRGALPLRMDEELAGEALYWFQAALGRRAEGEPLQYVEGFAWFYGRKFLVDGRVLIPRPDTETLLEAALSRLKGGMRALDLCTGSGILAVLMKLENPDATVAGTDISPDALEVACENARRLGAAVDYHLGDLFKAVPGTYDLIVSNPPYLTEGDMASLQREVRREPALALYGGTDGLDFYRRIAAELPERLNPGGTALFEVGFSQAGAVKEILAPIGAVQTIKDLCGAERVVTVERV